MVAQTFRTMQHGQTRGGVERLLVEEAGEVEGVHAGIVREDEGEVEGSCIGVLWLPYSQIVIRALIVRQLIFFLLGNRASVTNCP